jgi:hypothetical protein
MQLQTNTDKTEHLPEEGEGESEREREYTATKQGHPQNDRQVLKNQSPRNIHINILHQNLQKHILK